jgi:membrane-associated protease RseP (regulator of RpoE activity)
VGFGGYGGYGLGLGGYGLGYGGYGGYGYGYPGYGNGGYSYPYYGYGYGYPYNGAGYGMPVGGYGYSSAYVAPAVVNQGRYLGINEEAVAETGGKRGIKVTNVYPGTPAEKAGLHTGDVIHSINGYLTEERGNLAWIIANAAPQNTLKMNVRTVQDGKDHTITAQIP